MAALPLTLKSRSLHPTPRQSGQRLADRLRRLIDDFGKLVLARIVGRRKDDAVAADAVGIAADRDPTKGANWLANALTPFVGDANARTPEFKAFLVNLEKM